MSDDLKLLLEMLSYRRPMGSETEAEYIKLFIEPTGAVKDERGNWLLAIGENPEVLWSSHTDTVHGGPGRQNVVYTTKTIMLAQDSKSSCLGADCGAGNWLMLEMIKEKVPGLYIFHYGEERGCVGSSWIATKTPQVLSGIQSAIAFDRKDNHSIITHMFSGRTCSDAFATSLGLQLDGYRLDDTGSVTDTKQYKGLVPECTNISTGGMHEHTRNEYLDYNHLFRLRDMMLKIDPIQFIIERDPKEVSSSGGKTFHGGLGGLGGSLLGSTKPAPSAKGTISDILWTYPEESAAVLERGGIGYASLKALVLEEVDRRNRHFGRKVPLAPKPKVKKIISTPKAQAAE